MERTEVDIKENSVMELDSELLTILLHDKNSGKNIIWATEDYSGYGYGFGKADEIYVRSITGANGNIIRPRTEKTKKEQQIRIKDKAEVFSSKFAPGTSEQNKVRYDPTAERYYSPSQRCRIRNNCETSISFP